MIKDRIFYYINFKLLSPISIGNGITDLTDHDVIRDSDGNPYIPGSTLAGVFSHYLPNSNLFSNNDYQSPYFISDAITYEYKTSVRDGIELNDDKITKDGAKFNYEIIEPGTVFSFRIEITIRENDNISQMKNIVDNIINGLNKHDILIGYKSKRGLGKVEIINTKIKEFNSNNIDDIFTFDKYDENSYDNYQVKDIYDSNYKYKTIKVDLKQLGGINIRKYNTKKGDSDFEHIKSNGKAIIPGSSWNGLFRSQIKKYIELLNLDFDIESVFGSTKKASSIIFDESILESGYDVSLTRTKIDRFSGTAADTALFKESAYFNGNTQLIIKIDESINNNQILGLIALVIKDIDNGFISIGGQASIGRGLFSVINKKIDNDEFDLDYYIGRIKK